MAITFILTNIYFVYPTCMRSDRSFSSSIDPINECSEPIPEKEQSPFRMADPGCRWFLSLIIPQVKGYLLENDSLSKDFRVHPLT